ncbi:MAG: ThiF family adenylyltransferase [Planctomycetaceae bacterium]|nr:ThiF family adenylyltransferase [Planctomycetaceae bacterium]
MSRYRKQILFDGLGEAGQSRLRESRVLCVGCGALGSVIAESLVRAGVGMLRIADRDFVDLSNLQRQVLYDEEDVAQRLPKAIAAANKLRRINSDVVIEPHVADVTCQSVGELCDGVNLIMDGTDNFETRFLINDAAIEAGIPWIHAGCVGAHGQVMAIVPGQTPCLRCLMPEMPGPGTSETCDTAGVIGPAVQIVASLQVVAALKILSGQTELIRPELTVIDVWDGTLRQLKLSGLQEAGGCQCCGRREFPFLHGDEGSRSVVLCGRNSVQVAPSTSGKLSLFDLANRLDPSGEVQANPFLVRFRPDESEHELTIFADGRAIITGTEDLAEAKSLYARYIGA